MSEIKPAFTREEWNNRFAENPSVTTRLNVACEAFGDAANSSPLSHHQIAAFALYGQPFGFTREDVDVLRSVAQQKDADEPYTFGWQYDALAEIADRIAALLPPEGR